MGFMLLLLPNLQKLASASGHSMSSLPLEHPWRCCPERMVPTVS